MTNVKTQINISVRKARKEDVSQILELIKELAIFEKCEESVKITVKQLEEDGFGDDTPAYNCFVAENSSGSLVGFALYFNRYSTWGFGIGKKFIKELTKVAQQQNLRRIDFHVLKWNPAKEFYRKLGAVNATEDEDFEVYRFYEDTMRKLAQE